MGLRPVRVIPVLQVSLRCQGPGAQPQRTCWPRQGPCRTQLAAPPPCPASTPSAISPFHSPHIPSPHSPTFPTCPHPDVRPRLLQQPPLTCCHHSLLLLAPKPLPVTPTTTLTGTLPPLPLASPLDRRAIQSCSWKAGPLHHASNLVRFIPSSAPSTTPSQRRTMERLTPSRLQVDESPVWGSSSRPRISARA